MLVYSKLIDSKTILNLFQSKFFETLVVFYSLYFHPFVELKSRLLIIICLRKNNICTPN